MLTLQFVCLNSGSEGRGTFPKNVTKMTGGLMNKQKVKYLKIAMSYKHDISQGLYNNGDVKMKYNCVCMYVCNMHISCCTQEIIGKFIFDVLMQLSVVMSGKSDISHLLRVGSRVYHLH